MGKQLPLLLLSSFTQKVSYEDSYQDLGAQFLGV